MSHYRQKRKSIDSDITKGTTIDSFLGGVKKCFFAINILENWTNISQLTTTAEKRWRSGRMPNLMKHTVCRICGQNLENVTYDNMMAHANRHAAEKTAAEMEAKSQTGLDDFQEESNG